MKKNKSLYFVTSCLLSCVMLFSSTICAVATDDVTYNENVSVETNFDNNITTNNSTNDNVTSSVQEEDIDTKDNFTVPNNNVIDMSNFNLVKAPGSVDVFSSQYSSLMSSMVELGFGQRGELEIKKNEGYTLDAMGSFNELYGDLFPNGLKLEQASIPSDFDTKSMFANASLERDTRYSNILNSDKFSSIQNKVGISNVFSASQYLKVYEYTDAFDLLEEMDEIYPSNGWGNMKESPYFYDDLVSGFEIHGHDGFLNYKRIKAGIKDSLDRYVSFKPFMFSD